MWGIPVADAITAGVVEPGFDGTPEGEVCQQLDNNNDLLELIAATTSSFFIDTIIIIKALHPDDQIWFRLSFVVAVVEFVSACFSGVRSLVQREARDASVGIILTA